MDNTDNTAPADAPKADALVPNPPAAQAVETPGPTISDDPADNDADDEDESDGGDDDDEETDEA